MGLQEQTSMSQHLLSALSTTESDQGVKRLVEVSVGPWPHAEPCLPTHPPAVTACARAPGSTRSSGCSASPPRSGPAVAATCRSWPAPERRSQLGCGPVSYTHLRAH